MEEEKKEEMDGKKKVNEILNENPIPKTLKIDNSEKNSLKKQKTVSEEISVGVLLKDFEGTQQYLNVLSYLNLPKLLLYSYRYRYRQW